MRCFISTFPDARGRAVKKDDHPINGAIRATTVRLIGDSGEQLGVLPISEALKRAELEGLDLVAISPEADPPVCKILDYGKFKYQAQKKLHDARKKQKIVLVKEIFVRPMIDDHDFKVKLKQVLTFLENGDKVRITLRFRGRQVAYRDQGIKVIDRFIAEVGDLGKVDLAPKSEGSSIIVVLSPAV